MTTVRIQNWMEPLVNRHVDFEVAPKTKSHTVSGPYLQDVVVLNYVPVSLCSWYYLMLPASVLAIDCLSWPHLGGRCHLSVDPQRLGHLVWQGPMAYDHHDSSCLDQHHATNGDDIIFRISDEDFEPHLNVEGLHQHTETASIPIRQSSLGP